MPRGVLDDLAAKQDEFFVGHRGLGTIDLLVQHLDVVDAMLTAVSYRHDVIQ
jgi:hypothetical protein